MIGNTMTRSRSRWKLRWLLRTGLLTLALGSAGPAFTGAGGAAPTQRVVVDRNTGLAISGFDPVAYFTDGRALAGKGEFEQAFAGTVWRFRNAGNRAAFLAAPDVYMPRFAGYDPVGVARGVAVAGNPELWLIVRERLYLFFAADNRDRFTDDGANLAARAGRAWPALESTLAE